MAQIPYLDVQKLSKRFGSQVLFEDISFSIAEGQRVGLIAQNGTGKSTASVHPDRKGRLRVGHHYLPQRPAGGMP